MTITYNLKYFANWLLSSKNSFEGGISKLPNLWEFHSKGKPFWFQEYCNLSDQELKQANLDEFWSVFKGNASLDGANSTQK